MEDLLMYCSAALCLVTFVALKIFFPTRPTSKNLPPGPPYLPILGNILQIKLPLFLFFDDLAQKYGPFYSLSFESQLAIVVSSLSGCIECFTQNDAILANHLPLLKTKHLAYNNKTIVMSPYGDYWRNLRRIISLEMLSVRRINSFLSIRNYEINLLLRKLCRACRQDYAKVELRSMFADMSFNAAMRMVWGQWFYDDVSDVTDVEEVKRFREVLKDPELWPEPARFKPERYDNGEGDVRNLLTFGMGRRACPGEALALRTMGLAAAVLIQCFDWKRIGREAVDMTAANGLVMRRVAPLEVMCKARAIINSIQLQP